MRGISKLGALAAGLAAAGAILVPAASSARSHGQQTHNRGHRHSVSHVLLISVDGLHQSDLAWYVRHHPDSELAHLAGRGVKYENAQTPIPSDSFPGMVGLITGGNPRSTGVYYDAEYDHNLLPAGTTACTGQPTGAEVNLFEVAARNPLAIDSGQGLSGLPNNIGQLTGNPTTLLDPKALPVDPVTCKPVFPHQYLKVNTIFEVARQHGLRTAWSDKHAAYEILAGPSGTGIQDLFTPEINANAQNPDGSPATGDYTAVNSQTQQYDSYKVPAILNEIDGYDHSRTQQVGTPALFGMNFQTVSTAQKLPVSPRGSTNPADYGGYVPGTTTPGPVLSRALDYINTKLTAITDELRARGLAGSTAIIVSAKHGQAPQNPNDLTRIDDAAIIDGLNAAWKKAHPGAGNLTAADPGNTAAGSRDDAFPLWLTDRSQAAADFAKNYLLSNPATGNTLNPQNPAVAGPQKTLQHSGLSKVYAGAGAAHYFHVPLSDPRHPDVWGVVQHGVLYTGHTAKIAEHGGADPQDRHVPLVVYAPRSGHAGTVEKPVETTQIAPTILRLLGLDPHSLQAVALERTQVLPGS